MRGRVWRWVGVVLVLFVGLFFALDFVLLQYLSSRGAAEIARTMSAEEAKVDLGGFPFLFGFLRGDLSDVSVEVTGASAQGGLRVESIQARMDQVRFDAGDMFALARSNYSRQSKVRALQPFGILELREQDIEDFVKRAIPLVGEVAVKSTGIEVQFFKTAVDLTQGQVPAKEDLTKPARYLPRVVDGHLVLSLVSFRDVDKRFHPDAFRLEELVRLPQIPSGLQTSPSLRDGVVVLEVQGAETTLTVGQGEPPIQ